MSEKNLFDKMSLIDVDYVEAAVYPEAPQKMPLTSRRWWKPAVATAAALVLGVCCLSFSPQVRAFAANLFMKNATYVGDEPIGEANLDIVPINDVAPEAWDAEYDTLEEVEELLGITLLKSSKTFDAPVPIVTIGHVFNNQIISIWSDPYYVNDERIEDLTPHSFAAYSTGDNPYHISYYARFHANYEDISKTYDNYKEGYSFVENYTTANGLQAAIFQDSAYMTALIYHNNIRYELTMGGCNKVEVLEDYLETLS